jgi:hypothetical protein
LKFARRFPFGVIPSRARDLLFNKIKQLERAGHQLLGLTPGYDREMVEGNVVKRVYEAVFAKVLVPETALLRPDPKELDAKDQSALRPTLSSLNASPVEHISR